MSLPETQDKYRNGNFNSQAHREATVNVAASCQEIYSFVSEAKQPDAGTNKKRLSLEPRLLIGNCRSEKKDDSIE